MKTQSLFRSAGVFFAGVLAVAASAAAESIETSVKSIFKAVDAGDRAAMRTYAPVESMRFPVQFFDYDWDNKAVAIEGASAVNTYLETLFDELGKRNLKVTSVISKLRTGSSAPEMGFAVFDLTQTMTAGGKSDTAKFRTTMLLSQDTKSGKWRVFHSHATLVPADIVAGK
jgi:ketosteroid isomerase-like protein